ncbi:MAG: hypothetical protein NTZ80_00520 [Patescibacteria group bacterium]|nr:hypothetical protein [Patescibacteria group bacterium]
MGQKTKLYVASTWHVVTLRLKKGDPAPTCIFNQDLDDEKIIKGESQTCGVDGMTDYVYDIDTIISELKNLEDSSDSNVTLSMEYPDGNIDLISISTMSLWSSMV